MFRTRKNKRKSAHLSFMLYAESLARIYYVMEEYDLNQTDAAEKLINGKVPTPTEEQIAPYIKLILENQED